MQPASSRKTTKCEQVPTVVACSAGCGVSSKEEVTSQGHIQSLLAAFSIIICQQSKKLTAPVIDTIGHCQPFLSDFSVNCLPAPSPCWAGVVRRPTGCRRKLDAAGGATAVAAPSHTARRRQSAKSGGEDGTNRRLRPTRVIAAPVVCRCRAMLLIGGRVSRAVASRDSTVPCQP